MRRIRRATPAGSTFAAFLHRGGLVLAGCVWAATLSAQVTIHPRRVSPAAWERFALAVVNPSDTATVAVRLEVPDVVTILGVAPLDGWAVSVTPATDSTPQVLEWSGGQVRRGQFREFSFLGRVAGDARKRTLVFPTRLSREGAAAVDYRQGPGTLRAAPRIDIVGRAQVSTRGAVALSGAAIGIAVLALALAILGRRERSSANQPQR